MRVLVTRASEDAQRTARLLAARGHEAMIAPASAVVCRIPDDFTVDGRTYWIATSANALHCLSDHPQWRRLCRLPLYTVGDHTAAVARGYGIKDVTSARGTSRELVELIRNARKPGEPGLYVAGENRKPGLERTLRDAAYAMKVTIVYAFEPIPFPSPETRAALAAGEIDACILLSPTSAERVVAGIRQFGLHDRVKDMFFACNSPETAKVAQQAGFRRVAFSCEPRLDLVIDLLDRGRFSAEFA